MKSKEDWASFYINVITSMAKYRVEKTLPPEPEILLRKNYHSRRIVGFFTYHLRQIRMKAASVVQTGHPYYGFHSNSTLHYPSTFWTAYNATHGMRSLNGSEKTRKTIWKIHLRIANVQLTRFFLLEVEVWVCVTCDPLISLGVNDLFNVAGDEVIERVDMLLHQTPDLMVSHNAKVQGSA